jgi:hypothetical protein
MNFALTSLSIVLIICLTSCGEETTVQEEDHVEDMSETAKDENNESAHETEAESDDPENWKLIKLALANNDSEALMGLSSEKIDAKKMAPLVERIFQDDVMADFANTSYSDLTPIGKGEESVYAYYFGNDFTTEERNYAHEIEIYFKVTSGGLHLWNCMVAK